MTDFSLTDRVANARQAVEDVREALTRITEDLQELAGTHEGLNRRKWYRLGQEAFPAMGTLPFEEDVCSFEGRLNELDLMVEAAQASDGHSDDPTLNFDQAMIRLLTTLTNDAKLYYSILVKGIDDGDLRWRRLEDMMRNASPWFSPKTRMSEAERRTAETHRLAAE